jgi:Xaa-Pro aminopeptidase
MKNEIKQLMRDEGISAIWIMGAGAHNPHMVYMTGGGHVTNSDLFIFPDKEPVLYCYPMEREEAEKSGLETHIYTEYPMGPYMEKAEGDITKATAFRVLDLLNRNGVKGGKVLVYGNGEINKLFPLLHHVNLLSENIVLAGADAGNILQRAMMTKTKEEISRIRAVGEKTIEVVTRVEKLLASADVKKETLYREGKPLTIGAVKAKIDLWLAELGLENPEGVIFAIGRDAGIPHSSGTAEDEIKLGRTIVFDIFPCEKGGGYFHDFTRTWCVGYAPEEIERAYEEVQQTYRSVVESLQFNGVFKEAQTHTCESFKGLGHATIADSSAILEGYIHSVGHGVGLNIHELPFSGSNASSDEILTTGAVFTIEPGLYYPSKGFGIRLEDTYVVTEEGTFETLVDYPMDLVIHLKNGQ